MSTDNDDVLNAKPKATAIQKKKMLMFAAIAVGCFFFYIMFNATDHGIKEEVKDEPIKLGEDNLSDDEFEKFNNLVATQQETIVTLQNELDEFKKRSEAANKEQENALSQLGRLMEADKLAAEKPDNTPKLSNDPNDTVQPQRYPEAVATYQPLQAPPPPAMSQNLAAPETIGGVGFIEFAPVVKKKRDGDGRRVLSPPQFFQRETPNRD